MLINIEGTDSSGKQTQTRMLYEHLAQKGLRVKQISFPNYNSESSALVKMYLNGDFGKNPEDVNAKAASIFFACDRFASFRTHWKKYYESGYIIVSDRYTSSNIINQACKIDDIKEKMEFVSWLEELEYETFEIPKPDKTIFLNMPYEKSQELMKNRRNKISGEKQKDIHESNSEYLKVTYERSMEICEKLSWHKVDCVNEYGDLKTLKDINTEIIEIVEGMLNEK